MAKDHKAKITEKRQTDQSAKTVNPLLPFFRDFSQTLEWKIYNA